ncbi:MAG: fasciclin domain-containing protein [Hyphomonas sp.]|nr:fasciclin domain-containing protein [Hyphomonas sp.]
MKFRTPVLGAAAAALTGACTSTEAATETSGTAEAPPAILEPKEASVTAGSASMYPSKNIAENAVNSADHTTLVAAVVAAGLTETLSSPGPITVFAPVNDAFAALPAGTVDTLLLPENRDTLKKVLTAHVVAGDLKAADLIALAAANGGTATLTTVSGDTLTFAVDGGAAIVTDENGGRAIVTAADVDQSNGIIHVVDKVLLPN